MNISSGSYIGLNIGTIVSANKVEYLKASDNFIRGLFFNFLLIFIILNFNF
jgi:hypothetical protein